MANIFTRFTLQDDMSAKLQNITNRVNKLGDTLNNLGHNADSLKSKLNDSIQALPNGLPNINRFRDGFVSAINNVKNKLQSLQSVILSLYAVLQGFKSYFNVSDRVVNIDAKLNFITNGSDKKAFQQQLLDKSNKLGANYLDFSDQVIKMKMLTGDTFKTNSEVLRFNELLMKSFKIAGTGVEETRSAMLQLTQSLAAGRLQGDEFRSILENAPTLAQAIAKEMSVPLGKLKDLSSQGLITSEIIKSAMFNMADELDSKFSKLPKTWGQMIEVFKNKILSISQSVLVLTNKIANNDGFMKLISMLASGVGIVFNVLSGVLLAIVSFLGFIGNTLSWLYPVFISLGVILTMIYSKVIILTLATKLYSVAIGIAKGITVLFNGALSIMNALLMMNPIGLVVAAVTAFIGIIVAATKAVNYFCGTTYSALGVIVGAFYGAFATIGNIIITMVNLNIRAFNGLLGATASIGEALFNVFTNPIQAVKNFIVDTINIALNGIKSLLSIADKVTGSNLASKVQSFQDKLSSTKKYTSGMKKFTRDNYIQEMGYMNIKDMYKKGYSLGTKWEDKMKNIFNQDSPVIPENNIALDTENKLEDVNKTLGGIKENTDSMASSVAEWTEDVKLMRDLANREVINSVSAPVINVEVQSQNTINSEQDVESLTDKIMNTLTNAIVKGAENALIRSVN